MTQFSIEKMLAEGGNEWEHPKTNQKRIYFSPKNVLRLLGIEHSQPTARCVTSKSKTQARKIDGELQYDAKIFFDCNKNKFDYKGITPKYARDIIYDLEIIFSIDSDSE